MLTTSSDRSGWTGVPEWVSLVAAAILFVSPWLFGFAAEAAAARTAWISAAVIAVLSIAAIGDFAEWEGWVSLALGAWLLVAPWIIGFVANSHALTVFAVLGIIVALAACSEIWFAHHPGAPAH